MTLVVAFAFVIVIVIATRNPQLATRTPSFLPQQNLLPCLNS